jgi:Tfp pilus assembly protein PilP
MVAYFFIIIIINIIIILIINKTYQRRAFCALSSYIVETKSWMTENLIKFDESKTDAVIVYSKSSIRKPAALPLPLAMRQSFLPTSQSWSHHR